MPGTVIVRYTTHPEQAEENERLIRAVFADLAEHRPDGLRYSVTRLEDGVSFVHLATFEGEVNPLTASSAFGEFVSGIADRCVDPPGVEPGIPNRLLRGRELRAPPHQFRAADQEGSKRTMTDLQIRRPSRGTGR